LSVGLSNFAGAIGIGLSGINVRTRVRVGLAFGFFEALMPVIGLLVGHEVAGFFGQYGKYVGGAILILTGAYTIPQARTINLEQVLLSADGHVATVTLNRPDQRNPLSATMLRDLTSAFRWCQQEPDVRVVVLTGAGRVFCAGADLTSFDGEMSGLEKFRSRDLFVDLFVLMAELGKPIVGRINGHALAGGLGLASSCDILVTVDTATFGTPELNVGIWP